jgi:hypothetical protein
VIDPRISNGASSAKNTGTTVAREEQDREHDDRRAASDGVGDLSADEGSDGGGEDQRADDDAQLQVREPELGLHRTFRAVGHPGVVSEQQATEAGDDRDEADPFPIRAGNEWWKRGFTHAYRMCHATILCLQLFLSQLRGHSTAGCIPHARSRARLRTACGRR